MDVNTNYDVLENIYLENIENYVVISEEMYKTIIENINMNYLLILFTMSCLSTILLCPRKQSIQNKYIVVPTNDKEINTEIITETETVKGEYVSKI